MLWSSSSRSLKLSTSSRMSSSGLAAPFSTLARRPNFQRQADLYNTRVFRLNPSHLFHSPQHRQHLRQPRHRDSRVLPFRLLFLPRHVPLAHPFNTTDLFTITYLTVRSPAITSAFPHRPQPGAFEAFPAPFTMAGEVKKQIYDLYKPR